MFATVFSLSHPYLLAVLIGLLHFLVPTTSDNETSGGWLSRRVLRNAGGAVALTIAALMLAALATPAAAALLLALATLTAARTSWGVYRRLRGRLGTWRAIGCALARTLFWLVFVLLVARPQWSWTVTTWIQPLLVGVLDNSLSMGIVDRHNPDGKSRAALVNEAFGAAEEQLQQLERYYDVRCYDTGQPARLLTSWRIEPQHPMTALLSAVRTAEESRSADSRPPVAILLVSDGGENLAPADRVSRVAEDLVSRKTAVIALGVGPEAGSSAAVRFEPLAVPRQIGTRDRLRVAAVGSATGCQGHRLTLEVLWADEVADQTTIAIRRQSERFTTSFDVRPPHAGLHRLTVRARLPQELGAGVFETSAMISVRDDRIRVLLLESHPRNEAAFAYRALVGDPRFDVTQRLLSGRRRDDKAPPAWADYDVVLLGSVPAKRLGHRAVTALAEAVKRRAVGLALVGGQALLHDPGYNASPLEDISPVEFSPRKPEQVLVRLHPTPVGLRHPVLAGFDQLADEVWRRLPPIGYAADMRRVKPLAQVLAEAEDGRPLLVAHEVGNGRVVVAAWDSSWTWALADDEGMALHRRLWRQMVGWLANRRPTAWVVTDRTSYAAEALQSGLQVVRVRAGLSGAPREPQADQRLHARLQLTLREPRPADVASRPALPIGQPIDVTLRRDGDDWVAELPADLLTDIDWTAGRYGLALTITQDGERQDTFSAETGFEVSAQSLELTEPTANIELLRTLGRLTASVGGRYAPIDELPDVLAELVKEDPRRRIDRHERYDPVERLPWLLLAVGVLALALEWAWRKRAGLP